jgi:YD repeat-containing protein
LHRRDEDPNATPAIAWVARRNQNRLTETNPLGQQVQSAYDTRSRLVRMRLPGGQIREHYYTAFGRVSAQWHHAALRVRRERQPAGDPREMDQ